MGSLIGAKIILKLGKLLRNPLKEVADACILMELKTRFLALVKKETTKRKIAKNATYKISEYQIIGDLDPVTIENFGKACGNLLKEVFKNEF